MPNVNTLIVNRADKFGLTQLYQLRGRVGRGAKLAYAYFLFDKGQNLTPVAEKRLRTIYEATELGAGFGIAMKDLEIRGAGTLLGTRQTGHITAVGFHLYTQLLTSAVEKLKAKQAGIPETELVPSHLPSPSIDIPLVAFIPEEYVPDLITRLDLYQEMVKLDRPEQVDNLAAGFKDRFGPLPPEVENLLYATKVKVLAARAYIESVTIEHGEIVLRLVEGLRFERHKLEPVLRDGIRVGNNQLGLSRRRLGREWRDVLVDVLRRAG
jgi:transcription-repair coupling factor (superfamily II helicase)